MADPRKAASAQRFVAEPIQALGIDVPTLRGLTRGWVQRLKPTWRLAETCALCDLLFQEPEIETRAAGFLALGGFSRDFDPALFRRAERWINRHLDNWALVDGFASIGAFPRCSGATRSARRNCAAGPSQSPCGPRARRW